MLFEYMKVMYFTRQAETITKLMHWMQDNKKVIDFID